MKARDEGEGTGTATGTAPAREGGREGEYMMWFYCYF
jgi:hypothetical protein